MSHELRTPLNSITGFSDLMQKETLGPLGHADYRDYARHILGSGQRMLGIVNAMLDLSRMDAGQVEMHEELLDVSEVLADAIDGFHRLANEKGVTLKLEHSGSGPLRADPLRLRQALKNLLFNAIQFTPEGGFVTAFGVWEGSRLEVGVSDTGIGMSADQIPVALSAFGQTDMALSRSSGGIGLGLPITKKIAELHGATLKISSTPGCGTRVAISFPDACERRADRPSLEWTTMGPSATRWAAPRNQ